MRSRLPFLGNSLPLRAGALLLASATIVHADPIRFVPPTDPVGRVYTTDDNDAWDGGRGVVFSASAPATLESVALLHDLTDITLSFSVAAIPRIMDSFIDGQTVLRSGSALVSTSGLEWITFSFPRLQLLPGQGYHIEFSFSGDGNQNFFHTNCPLSEDLSFCDRQIRYSVGPFSNVDGTQAGDTGNFVQPAIRVEVSDTPPVPEPSTLVLVGISAAVGAIQRRRPRGAEAPRPR